MTARAGERLSQRTYTRSDAVSPLIGRTPCSWHIFSWRGHFLPDDIQRRYASEESYLVATGFSNVDEIASFMAWQLDDIPHSTGQNEQPVYIFTSFEDIGTLTIRDHRPKRKTNAKAQVEYPDWIPGEKRIAINGVTVYYYNEHQIFDCLRDIDRARRSCNTLHRR